MSRCCENSSEPITETVPADKSSHKVLSEWLNVNRKQVSCIEWMADKRQWLIYY